MNRFMFSFAALALLAGFAPVQAVTLTYDFETFGTGSYGSISTTQGGVTATVVSNGSGSFDVTGALGPPSWGSRSLISYFSGGNGFVVSSSTAVAGVGISFGDYNADDDTPVTLTAYSGVNGTGAVLGTSTVSYPGSANIGSGDSGVGFVSVSAANIRSFIVSSGGSFPGSIYYDNVQFTTASAVPEPTSMTLLGLGVAGLAGYGVRRRKLAKVAA